MQHPALMSNPQLHSPALVPPFSPVSRASTNVCVHSGLRVQGTKVRQQERRWCLWLWLRPMVTIRYGYKKAVNLWRASYWEEPHILAYTSVHRCFVSSEHRGGRASFDNHSIWTHKEPRFQYKSGLVPCRWVCIVPGLQWLPLLISGRLDLLSMPQVPAV
jgi:hypothetical protein